VVRNSVSRVQFNSTTELMERRLIVLLFIVEHATSVVCWSKFRIDIYNFVEELHSLLEPLLFFEQQSHMVENINVLWLKFGCSAEIVLLLTIEFEFVVAQSSVVISLEVLTVEFDGL
jgi:hypothetical protein